MIKILELGDTVNYLVIENNQVIGSCSAIEYGPRQWALENGYITLSYRNRGFYTKMFEFRHKDILSRNPVYLQGICNDVSRKLYDKLGFEFQSKVDDNEYFYHMIIAS